MSIGEAIWIYRFRIKPNPLTDFVINTGCIFLCQVLNALFPILYGVISGGVSSTNNSNLSKNLTIRSNFELNLVADFGFD